jgi:hypothetical protein
MEISFQLKCYLAISFDVIDLLAFWSIGVFNRYAIIFKCDESNHVDSTYNNEKLKDILRLKYG